MKYIILVNEKDGLKVISEYINESGKLQVGLSNDLSKAFEFEDERPRKRLRRHFKETNQKYSRVFK